MTEVSPLVVWLARADPWESRDRFVESSRTEQPMSVYDLVAWEVDYLAYLFPTARWDWTADPSTLEQTRPDVVVWNSNTFTLGGSSFGRWAPKILVYLSDEYGKTPQVHRHTLGIPLVLRQHHHPHYFQAPNVRQIPLGFMGTMFDEPQDIPRGGVIEGRRYVWSYVGRLSPRRQFVIDLFRAWGPHFAGSAPPRGMAAIYGESTFVLCPRGGVKMDCFRNYEATLCGALPVVAGCSKLEYEATFSGIGSPPWVFAPSWQGALELCRTLMSSGALPDMQRANLEWWRHEMQSIRKVTTSALAGEDVSSMLALARARHTSAGLEAWLRRFLGRMRFFR